MFAEEFNKIFAELESIENTLESEGNSCDRENIKQRLLDLRSNIDEYLGYWLGFEEKLWELQEKYKIDVPDQLDESLILAYLEGSGLSKYLEIDDSKSDEDILNKIFSSKKPSDELTEDTNNLSDDSKNLEETKDKTPIETLERGLGYFELLMYDEAKEELEKVVTLNPNMSIAHFYLGLVNAEKGNYEKGLKELRLVLALIQEEELKGVIYNFIGNIYIKQNMLEKALINFNRACECSPSFFDAHFNLGATYFNLGEFSKSESVFKKALQIKTGDWETHLNLGKALSYQAKYNEALKHYRRALALNPKEGKIHFELGLVHELLQNKELAKKEYSKAKNCIKKDKKS